MRSFELAIIVFAMLIPFITMKAPDFRTFAYWHILTAFYLLYTAVRRWEYE